MKRTFSWPLFVSTAAALAGATWFLVESRETRIAGTISALVIAWGFVRFCVVHVAPSAVEEGTVIMYGAGDDADSLVRNDIWTRHAPSAATPEQFETQLKLPLLAVVRPRP